MIKIITFLIMLSTPLLVRADVTTQQLLAQCKNKSDALDIGLCIGYIAGLKGGHQVTNSAAYLMGKGAYNLALNESFVKKIPQIPDAALKAMAIQSSSEWYGCWGDKSYGQIKAVFVKFAEDNPRLWHESASSSLTYAMRKAFPQPCKYAENKK